jgi:hypothetical protein
MEVAPFPIKVEFLELLKAKLMSNNINFNFNKFIETLRKYNIKIGGSFVLSILKEILDKSLKPTEIFKPDDIDLYILSNITPRQESELIDTMKNIIDRTNYLHIRVGQVDIPERIKLYQSYKNDQYAYMVNEYSQMNNIQKIINIKTKYSMGYRNHVEFKMQIVIIKDELGDNINEYFKKYVDFYETMNYFDGYNLYLQKNYQNIEKSLITFNVDNINNKQTINNSIFKYMNYKLLCRLFKYINYKFILNMNNSTLYLSNKAVSNPMKSFDIYETNIIYLNNNFKLQSTYNDTNKILILYISVSQIGYFYNIILQGSNQKFDKYEYIDILFKSPIESYIVFKNTNFHYKLKQINTSLFYGICKNSRNNYNITTHSYKIEIKKIPKLPYSCKYVYHNKK